VLGVPKVYRARLCTPAVAADGRLSCAEVLGDVNVMRVYVGADYYVVFDEKSKDAATSVVEALGLYKPYAQAYAVRDLTWRFLASVLEKRLRESLPFPISAEDFAKGVVVELSEVLKQRYPLDYGPWPAIDARLGLVYPAILDDSNLYSFTVLC
jgi:hypothetical protein